MKVRNDPVTVNRESDARSHWYLKYVSYRIELFYTEKGHPDVDLKSGDLLEYVLPESAEYG